MFTVVFILFSLSTCVHVIMCLYRSVHIHVSLSLYITYMYIDKEHAQIHLHACTFTFMHKRTTHVQFLYVYTCIYVYIHIQLLTMIHICANMYMRLYAHTRRFLDRTVLLEPVHCYGCGSGRGSVRCSGLIDFPQTEEQILKPYLDARGAYYKWANLRGVVGLGTGSICGC